jgi:hypothetical protein
VDVFIVFKFLHIVSMFFAVALALSGEIVLRRVATSESQRNTGRGSHSRIPGAILQGVHSVLRRLTARVFLIRDVGPMDTGRNTAEEIAVLLEGVDEAGVIGQGRHHTRLDLVGIALDEAVPLGRDDPAAHQLIDELRPSSELVGSDFA